MRPLDTQVNQVCSLISADVEFFQLDGYSGRQRTLPNMGGNEAGLGTDLGTDFGCWPAGTDHRTAAAPPHHATARRQQRCIHHRATLARSRHMPVAPTTTARLMTDKRPIGPNP